MEVTIHCLHWTKETLLILMSHNRRKTVKAELPKDGVNACFNLCHKLSKVGKKEVPFLCSCDHGQGTEITHPLGCSQSHQEKRLPRQIPERCLIWRFKGRTLQGFKDHVHISWSSARRPRNLPCARLNNLLENCIRGEFKPFEDNTVKALVSGIQVTGNFKYPTYFFQALKHENIYKYI